MSVKLYAGKLFSLKGKSIPWSTKTSPVPYYRRRLDDSYKEGSITKDNMPEQVMVFDESSKKVKIFLPEVNMFVWISKYYLREEISTIQENKACDLLEDSITLLVKYTKFKKIDFNSNLFVILKNLRTVKELLEKEEIENEASANISTDKDSKGS